MRVRVWVRVRVGVGVTVRVRVRIRVSALRGGDVRAAGRAQRQPLSERAEGGVGGDVRVALVAHLVRVRARVRARVRLTLTNPSPKALKP